MKLADGNPLCLNPDTKSVKSWNISKQRLVTVQHMCSVPADWQNNAIGWGASISKTQTFLKPTSTPEISVLSHSVTQYVLRSLFWSVYQCSQVRPEAQHVGTGQGLQSWSTCCCKTTSCSPGCICFCYLKWCKQRKVLMVFLREENAHFKCRFEPNWNSQPEVSKLGFNGEKTFCTNPVLKEQGLYKCLIEVFSS